MTATLARLTPYTWKTVLVLAVIGAGWWTAVHGVAGVHWVEVFGVLGGVTTGWLIALAAIWLGGLGVYSLVISAALPGLGVRRSFVLSLSGSAVANVVPLGGAVATALNWRMVRVWGHSDRAFVAFCVLTNALDVLTKLLLPMIAVAALVTLSMHVPTVLAAAAAACGAAILAALLAQQALRLRPGSVGTRPDSRWRLAVRGLLRDSGTRIRGLLSSGWRQLLPASVVYVATQVLLLYVALHAVGLPASPVTVLVAAAIERLGTLIPITPGGTGVAEVATIAWLVASGLDPVEVVAGVLLYRLFLIVMEIPLGGVLLGGWAWTHRAGAREAVPAATETEVLV